MNRHNAPPVVYPVGRSAVLARFLFGTWLAGFVSVLLWWNVTRPLDGRAALAGLSVLVAGLAARASWGRLPSGQLAWNGDVWCWESSGYQSGVAEQNLSVLADFQHRLLLKLENQAGASLWLWVEKTSMPERWLDLRRAVYSPHKPSTAFPLHDLLPLESTTLSPASAASSNAMHASQGPWAKP